MKSCFNTIVLFALFYHFSFAQSTGFNFDWCYGVGSSGHDQPTAMCLDDINNLYVTGNFIYSVDFDHGPSSNTLNSVDDIYGTPNSDSFVCKYDSLGQLIWAKFIGGFGLVTSREILLTSQNQIIIAGTFHGACDFNPGSGTYSLTSDVSYDPEYDDIFIMALDTTGNFLWAKKFGAQYQDVQPRIVSDNVGDIILSGQFYGTMDFNTGLPDDIHTAPGGLYANSFIAKIDNNGNVVWNGFLTGLDHEGIDCINIRNDGSIVLAGDCSATSAYRSDGNIDSLDVLEYSNFYVLCIDQNGQFLWNKAFESIHHLNNIVSSSNNELYISGTFKDTIDLDLQSADGLLVSNGAEDIFVLKLDELGTFNWSKSFGSFPNEQLLSTSAANNLILLSGQFFSPLDFDPGFNELELIPASGYAGFVNALDLNGNFIFANQFGHYITDLECDTNNHLYGVGTYVDPINLSGNSDTIILNEFGQLDYMSFRISMDNSIVSNANITDDNKNMFVVAVYPNPVSNELTVSFNENFQVEEIIITNYEGKIVHEQKISDQSIIVFNVSDLAPGIYTVNLISFDNLNYMKLIKL